MRAPLLPELYVYLTNKPRPRQERTTSYITSSHYITIIDHSTSITSSLNQPITKTKWASRSKSSSKATARPKPKPARKSPWSTQAGSSMAAPRTRRESSALAFQSSLYVSMQKNRADEFYTGSTHPSDAAISRPVLALDRSSRVMHMRSVAQWDVGG